MTAISLKRIGLEQDFAVLKIVVFYWVFGWTTNTTDRKARTNSKLSEWGKAYNGLREPKSYYLNLNINFTVKITARQRTFIWTLVTALVNSIVN